MNTWKQKQVYKLSRKSMITIYSRKAKEQIYFIDMLESQNVISLEAHGI